MLEKKYDFCVFAGRFQPFHVGHWSVLNRALDLAEHVIVITGSSNRPRTARNPLTFEERSEIILSSLSSYRKERVIIVPQDDYIYNDDRWVASVQANVASAYVNSINPKTCLIGHKKDGTSYYLKMFPQWYSENVDMTYPVNATDIRDAIYSGENVDPQWFVNIHHMNTVLQSFMKPEMDVVFEEHKFLKDYRKQWSVAPYPPTFVTVDAVVVQSGHVLMVERGAMPGKGQWALPGGFIGQYETAQQSMIRELYEETKLAVPKPVIKGSITKNKVYDNPWRSQRGRTITHAFLVELTDDLKLPRVKGSDDAAKARWISFSDLSNMKDMIYEDHADIIDDLVGGIF